MSDPALRGDLEFGTIPQLVRIAADRYGDAAALVDVDVGISVTYHDLAIGVRNAAASWMACGIGPGDRVAIWAPNTWEWVVAALGAHTAGAVIVPLNTRYKGREAAYILEKSGARALATVVGFLDTDYVGLLRAAVDVERELPALHTILVLRGDAPAGTVSGADFADRGTRIKPADVEHRCDAVAPDDLSDILFTSGTTGAPKGVMTTHAQNLRAFRDWADVVGLRAGDRYLVVNPFFHSFGYKAGILAALMTGATLYPHAVFDADAVLARIPRDGISMIPGPPSLFQAILARPDLDQYDISTLRLAVTGAAPTPVSLVEQMRDRLGFENVITGYGLTEACGIATMCRHDDDPVTIANTSGRAIPGVEVRAIDDDGTEVARGEPGEIVVRGYNVMRGYFEAPEETAHAIDADGWLHTGDIGVMDERGYVRITDRKKDMFIVGGFNAYPAEIESLILGHPAVAQAAVIGVSDDRLGEVGWAFVVRKPGAALEADELISWCRDEMANFKVPRHVEFCDALPMNATGKVLKYELRERASRG
ncbi:MAG: Acyl-CoA synthase [Actinomycetia bacterium]|nr:Acyl-CoA synthase [Actinomycetes bacterium]